MANLFRCAGAGGEDIKCIERPYNSNDIYNTGDTAMYNGLLRICTADGVTGEFDVSKWEVTTLDELLGENIGENDALVDYIASEYDPTHTYTAGDAILGDNAEILKCLADGVTGEFDKSKWGRDYLCNLSGNVNSNLKIYDGDLKMWMTKNANATSTCRIPCKGYSALHLVASSFTGTSFKIYGGESVSVDTTDTLLATISSSRTFDLDVADYNYLYITGGVVGTSSQVNLTFTFT